MGSLAANLVDISARVCGGTQERFRRLENNQLIAWAKVEEAEFEGPNDEARYSPIDWYSAEVMRLPDRAEKKQSLEERWGELVFGG